jgi:predicted nucleic acid-binding Zn ribbon protein
MIPVQQFGTGVLAQLLRRQPSTPARTAFAWQLAVGATLARATRVSLVDGVLHVSARDPRWLQEVSRARAVVLERLQEVLGPEVTSIAIDATTDARSR